MWLEDVLDFSKLRKGPSFSIKQNGDYTFCWVYFFSLILYNQTSIRYISKMPTQHRALAYEILTIQI